MIFYQIQWKIDRGTSYFWCCFTNGSHAQKPHG